MLRKRICSFLLSILAVTMLLPVQTLAARAIDVDAMGSIRVQIAPDNEPQEGVEVRLYRVASVSRDCRYTLIGAFADYSVSLDVEDAETWRSLAATLDGYVRTDSLTADYTAKTDVNGIAVFDPLPTGLYLVTGERWNVSPIKYYTPTPFLVSLPNLNEADEWVYDLQMNAKLVPGQQGGGSAFQEISVLKVWEDDDSEERPTEIEVELYNGSVLKSTVTLSKANNWRHTWSNLDPEGDWIVREKEVPEDYTVSIEKQGTRFVLTNTADPDLPVDPEDPDVPVDPDDPEYPDDPDTPVDPDDPDTPAEPDEPDEPGLPQTGVLWWPVPVLLAAGLALILLGMLRRRSAYED